MIMIYPILSEKDNYLRSCSNVCRLYLAIFIPPEKKLMASIYHAKIHNKTWTFTWRKTEFLFHFSILYAYIFLSKIKKIKRNSPKTKVLSLNDPNTHKQNSSQTEVLTNSNSHKLNSSKTKVLMDSNTHKQNS